MLNPGTIILFSPRYDGRQPAPRIACCRRPTLSTKSPSRPISLSSEAAHG